MSFIDIIDNSELDELICDRHFKKNEIFLKQGYAAPGLYVIIKGKCQLFSRTPGEKTLIPVALRGPDELLAEVSFINECNMLTSVKALTDVHLRFIPHEVLTGLSYVMPEKAIQILTPIVELICSRIRASVSNLKEEELFLPCLQNTKELTSKQLRALSFNKIKDILEKQNLIELPIFKQIPEGHLLDFINAQSFYQVKKNQLLFRQDEAYDCVYHVLSGALQTFTHCPQGATKLTIIGPGGTTGLTHFIDKSTSIINCMVREDALLLKISQKDLDKTLKYSPLMHHRLLLYLYRNVAVTFNKFYMHYLQSKSIHYLF